jgi:hypothetical protein
MYVFKDYSDSRTVYCIGLIFFALVTVLFATSYLIIRFGRQKNIILALLVPLFVRTNKINNLTVNRTKENDYVHFIIIK